MKDNLAIKIWKIVYPILIFYAVMNVVMSLLLFALGITEENYTQDYLLLQTIATIVAIPFIYSIFKKDRQMNTVFHQRTGIEWKEDSTKEKWIKAILAFVCGALAGLALNNIISVTGLTEISEGYQEVTEHFYAGTFALELIGLGILAPVLEELLYRGVIYGRLSDWMKPTVAAVLSALIFGILHGNIVQFVYAFLMGLLLVYFLEVSHSILGSLFAHIGANVITVIRTESAILAWMDEGIGFWISTVIMVLICIGIIVYLKKHLKNTGLE